MMPSLTCIQLDLDQASNLPAELERRALGAIGVGVPGDEVLGAMPFQAVAMPLLEGQARAVVDIWLSAEALRSGEQDGIRFRFDDHVLFAVLTLDERDFAEKDDVSALQQATRHGYARLFRLLDQLSYPYLWRVWNYLADINGEQDGLERYRQFNVGRQQAYEACDRAVQGFASAACALGAAKGPLTVAVMAGKAAPLLLENPRQVRAYEYPLEYGPRSPIFSRAALVNLPGQEQLFISGTASIVGHRTMHPGDVAAQTRETLANIAAVLDEANRVAPGVPFTLPDLNYRAYVRHAADLPAVRTEIQQRVGTAQVQYVQADVCRSDLLVEIEAMASRPAEMPSDSGSVRAA